MQGRPYVRFLFAENAVGDRPLVTLPTGDVIEDQYPVRPYGRLGQLAFIVDDNTNHYEASYLVYLATVVQNAEELEDAKLNAKPVLQIMDLENDRVYASNKKTSGADILFIVDSSGSMTQDMAYLKAAIPGLFRALDAAGCTDVRVGLMVYTTDYKQHKVGKSLWATYSGAAVSMFTGLAIWNSSSAHAASAIRWGLDNYKFLETASKKYIVLVTDTGREGDPITPADVEAELIDKGIILNVIAKDDSYYGDTARATGGQFIDTTGLTDWTDILTNTLGGSLIGGILDPRPTIWSIQMHPDDNTQYLLPPQATGIGHLVYDEYHEDLWYVQPNGVFLLIASNRKMPNVNCQFVEAVASTTIEFGQLLFMDTDGSVRPAMWDSGKAVGYALHPCNPGQKVKIQVGGVFEDYDRWILTPGTVYYQSDDGEIRWPESVGDNYAHPAALALTKTSFIILTEIYMGTGGPGGGESHISISGVNVVRTETKSVNTSPSVVSVMKNSDVLTEIFDEYDWTTTTYMRKQYVTCKNTSLLQTLQVVVENLETSTTVAEIVPVGEELTFPIYTEDWELSCRGEWDISLITEVIAGVLPSQIVTDTSTLPDGTKVYEYVDPADKTTKYVVLGQVKRFDVDVAGEEVLFDFPQWIADTITSENYMVIGSIRLVNTNTADVETIHVMKDTDTLYDFDLAPLEETLVELNREDIKFVVDSPGNVEAHLRIQATAYSFNE